MKLTKRQIILSIITGIIVCVNLAYYLISRVDNPIAIKKYSELFFNDTLTIEMIKENNGDLERESEWFFNDGVEHITVEFPEINKTYYMSAYNSEGTKNKYKLLRYCLNMDDDFEKYINDNGPVTLTRAIIIDRDKNYDVDLGEITLNPYKNQSGELKMELRSSESDNGKSKLYFLPGEDVYLNKIESKYLDELKEYYNIYIMVDGEKIPVENIKYPYKIKKGSDFQFIVIKKDNINIDSEKYYYTYIRVELGNENKETENSYVRVRNKDSRNLLNEKSILNLKYNDL
ncbi:MAG: hypothetical protein KIB43_10750 [Clostridium baratii]|uniref:hypothetical protein n=1 Tax=Clostridium baratii TaxID=1561 RepID=UPI00242BF985|nr:hypothetical protein [Clostridium baratii]MBS6007428.1 hypothetical protein [Clostridium baratii]